MILVISYPDDPHAQAVMDHLRQWQEDVVLFDVSDLPNRATITFDYADPKHPLVEFHLENSGPVDLARAQSVWWWRPQAAELTGVIDPDAHLFATNEWHEAISGLWQLLDARWINPPTCDEVASRKCLQLRVASQMGLAVPRTLITSDPGRARRFIEGRDQTIFKTFSATHAIWRETRLIRDEELEVLDTVRLAPVIFQEYIPAEADLRVTIVGDRLFPAAIFSQDTDYPVDFRMSLGQSRVEPAALPADVTDKLLKFMKHLGLVYGAIDLRRTPEGEYVFLEVNTAGEFLFIEERTGQQISKALAEWLARPH